MPSSLITPLRRGTVVALVVSAVAAIGLLLPVSKATADPSANDWYRLRMCESSDNYAINTGNGYYGAYQFDLGTWRSVGGSGYPNHASPAEQDARALILYRERGWQPWTCAGMLGLKEDADARSGRVSDFRVQASASSPAWPGTYYVQGMKSTGIATWQKQMVKRGATQLAPGTGQFGALTAAVVAQVQAQNGIPRSGRIGPQTWAAAWNGAYRNATAAKAPTAVVKPSAPKWPGRYYVQGMHNGAIAIWQKQMVRRGAKALAPDTGQFGGLTQAVVNRVQRLNGIPRSGRIGPQTWAAAWSGKY